MRNWKTTLAGIVVLLGLVVKVVNGTGIGPDDLALGSAALGLLFAKDFDKSHTQP